MQLAWKAAAGVAALAAALAAAGTARAGKATDDVAIKMKVSDGLTAGPLAKIQVKNRGTATQAGVLVEIRAESGEGALLWSGTVDLVGKKAAKLEARVFLDETTTALVATATPAGAADERPADNVSRAALGVKGKKGVPLVGRAIHLASCASCHGDGADGGTAPSLVGTSPKPILAQAAAGGDHDFPWMSKTDAKALAAFFRSPSGVVLPDLPTPPEGGWPTYEEGGVQALLDGRCGACHSGAKADAGIWLSSYDAASKSIRRAIGAVKNGSMPQGGKRFTPAETGLLEDWVTGGKRP